MNKTHCKACLVIITGWILFTGCTNQQPDQVEIDWIQVTEQAEWQPRDSAAEYAHDGKLWILGGWFTPQDSNPRDIWSSTDGSSWEMVSEKVPMEYTDLPGSLVFQNRLWLLGGRKLPGTDVTNEVWSSPDGQSWILEGHASWSPRLAPGFAVFRDKMWILGGTEDFYQNNEGTLFNDVWSSRDGKEWNLETGNASWPARTHGQAIAFDGKLWVMGGGQRAPDVVARNDVWSSEDGVHWTLVTESADWDPRLWFSLVVYRDHMWVLGGWSDVQGNFGDVWYSKDGRNWTELETETIWTPRHEHSSYVFDDKIWVAGGAAGTDNILDSEVWQLSIPEGWLENHGGR
ncbi:Kelch repeat-containing protein [Fodinibius roseus]|nr:galactose oxidase [Fodinibius roseus]